MNMSQVPTVMAADAIKDCAAGAILIDVREPNEWAAGHSPAARHLPLNTVLANIDTIPRDQAVLIICRSGNRSSAATHALREEGIRAYNVAGGMRAWERLGGEVLLDDGTPGTVI